MTQICEAYVGLLWGDEGKAKILDESIERAKSLNDGKRIVVVRFQGGPNAGHTIWSRSKKGNLIRFIAHACPSGVVSNTDIAIGPHVAFDPEKFQKEIEEAKELFNFNGKILISERTGILLDYHRQLDAFRESNSTNIGTTKSGIGPFYEDSARRLTRVTFLDYISDNFPEKLRNIINLKKQELQEANIITSTYVEDLLKKHESIRKALKPYAVRLEYRLREYLEKGDHIILEGAQGTLLDIDMGTIPMVTSSHTLITTALSQLMLPRKKFKIYGIEKLYPTRVGNGPFPTHEKDIFCREVAKNAGEFGATTGRPRKVGYPDLVAVKRSALLNDCDFIIITRVDNVQGKEIKICTKYEFNGNLTEEMPLDLDRAKPIYSKETFSWQLWDGPEDLSDPSKVDLKLKKEREKYIKNGFDSLPGSLKRYIEYHDNYIGIPTTGISIGPCRGETVIRNL